MVSGQVASACTVLARIMIMHGHDFVHVRRVPSESFVFLEELGLARLLGGCNNGGGGGNLWPVKRLKYEHMPRFIFSKAFTAGQGGIKETQTNSAAPETPLLPTVRHNRPTRSISRTGSVVSLLCCLGILVI